MIPLDYCLARLELPVRWWWIYFQPDPRSWALAPESSRNRFVNCNWTEIIELPMVFDIDSGFYNPEGAKIEWWVYFSNLTSKKTTGKVEWEQIFYRHNLEYLSSYLSTCEYFLSLPVKCKRLFLLEFDKGTAPISGYPGFNIAACATLVALQ